MGFKSASILGREFGLSGQEMNFILKEEGFLYGEPGAYGVTEKGEPFAHETDFHRGTGGYDWYNRYWTERSWDEKIKDEIDLSEERIKELRQTIADAKQKIKDAATKNEKIEFESLKEDGDGESDLQKTILLWAVIVLLLAVATYGVYKAAPHIKRWWTRRAVPSIKTLSKNISSTSVDMWYKLVGLISPDKSDNTDDAEHIPEGESL